MNLALSEPRPELLDRISSALTELNALNRDLGAARLRLQQLSADLGGACGEPEEAPARNGTSEPEMLPPTLTARELEVLALMATGCTNNAIAQRLMIADGTAKKHVFRVLRKLGVTNRSEAVAYWFRAGENGRTPVTH